MRARCVFEKFTEDGDPIHDMGIGILPKLKALKEKYRSLTWEYPEPKDVMRIENIVKKSKGNTEKERMYAKMMANAIDDKFKAYRRYLAAKNAGGDGWDVTQIFLIRVLELFGIN